MDQTANDLYFRTTNSTGTLTATSHWNNGETEDGENPFCYILYLDDNEDALEVEDEHDVLKSYDCYSLIEGLTYFEYDDFGNNQQGDADDDDDDDNSNNNGIVHIDANDNNGQGTKALGDCNDTCYLVSIQELIIRSFEYMIQGLDDDSSVQSSVTRVLQQCCSPPADGVNPKRSKQSFPIHDLPQVVHSLCMQRMGWQHLLNSRTCTSRSLFHEGLWPFVLERALHKTSYDLMWRFPPNFHKRKKEYSIYLDMTRNEYQSMMEATVVFDLLRNSEFLFRR